MEAAIQKRDPETQAGIPVWCHKHCGKMKLEIHGSNLVKIASHSAKVVITRASSFFFVDWEISFSSRSRVNGRVIMTAKDVRSAFGLSHESGMFGDSLISRYGADAANQGQYIRWGDFLNIPCPGTGYDGDPNISIELDGEIKEAVVELLTRPA